MGSTDLDETPRKQELCWSHKVMAVFTQRSQQLSRAGTAGPAIFSRSFQGNGCLMFLAMEKRLYPLLPPQNKCGRPCVSIPGGWAPAGTHLQTGSLTSSNTFQACHGGRGRRQFQWHLLGEQHKCQQHSGFARRLAPKRGWAQDWSRAWRRCPAVGRADPVGAGKEVSESPLYQSLVV